jgi:hypothetical protein
MRKSDAIIQAIRESLENAPRKKQAPPLWDGKTAQRIVDVIRKYESGGLKV